MIPTIKKILYATDLSDNTKCAAGYAALLGDKLDAEITVLHVLDDPNSASRKMVKHYLSEEDFQELQGNNLDSYRTIIKKRINQFFIDIEGGVHDYKFTNERVVLREGNPAVEIVAEAEGGSYDMVIIGSHGHGTLAGVLLGDNAQRVVRKCKIPVTVIRLPEADKNISKCEVLDRF